MISLFLGHNYQHLSCRTKISKPHRKHLGVRINPYKNTICTMTHLQSATMWRTTLILVQLMLIGLLKHLQVLKLLLHKFMKKIGKHHLRLPLHTYRITTILHNVHFAGMAQITHASHPHLRHHHIHNMLNHHQHNSYPGSLASVREVETLWPAITATNCC